MKRLGRAAHGVDVANEYVLLAKQDEKVASSLEKDGEYRHAMYFYIQAMEKYIRGKIFSIVNPNLQYFRDQNQHHSLGDAIEFLLEILTTDQNVREMIKQQLNVAILGDINYQFLHNSLRYPFYSSKFDSYSVNSYSKEDCHFVREGLIKLKVYLKDIDKIARI